MAYGTLNADQIQSSVSGVSLGGGNASLMKNRIINGAMVIDQRDAGASVTPANGQYTLDRWVNYQSQASKFSIQQNAGAASLPVGFSNYLGVTSLSAYALTSTDLFLLRQFIEGYNIADLSWGTANAKTVTLSFWAYSSLTGTFGGCIANNGNAAAYPFTFSIPSANTWTQISVTIPGPTSGTWATTNTIGIGVNFNLGTGSTYNGTPNTWIYTGAIYAPTGANSIVSTNGATFYITGVQLEVGSVATGFEYRHYQQELALCQRYYWKSIDGGGSPLIWGNSAGVGGLVYTPVIFPVQMRATPTVTPTGTWTTNGYSTNNPPVASYISATGFGLYISCNASGQAYLIPNNAGNFVAASAEL